MFSANRSRLYAFVLSLSSAITFVGLPFNALTAETGNGGKELNESKESEESRAKQIGRKFKTDFNLMQNLMMQLEQVNAEPKPLAVENGQKLKRDRSNTSKLAESSELTSEDQKWVEDEIGVKAAGINKEKSKIEKSVPANKFPKVKNTRIRVRSR